MDRIEIRSSLAALAFAAREQAASAIVAADLEAADAFHDLADAAEDLRVMVATVLDAHPARG